MRPMLLSKALQFPDPRLFDAEGLVAVGGDLSVERLLLAYQSGIFPWSANPITWWSPDPRGILDLEAFHVPRSLGRAQRRGGFTVTRDRAFRAVIEGCAEPGSRARPDLDFEGIRRELLPDARARPCAQRGVLAGQCSGWRDLWCGDCRAFCRGIHVPPHNRCFKDGLGSSGGASAIARLWLVRSPNGHRCHGALWGDRGAAGTLPGAAGAGTAVALPVLIKDRVRSWIGLLAPGMRWSA